MMWDGWMIHGMWGGLMMLIFWIILIVGIVFLVKWIMDRNRTTNRQEPDESPLEILRRRYAKGEITKEEFEAMKRELASS